MQPDTPTGLQSRADDGSSIDESDGLNVADMHVGQQARMPLRRSARISSPHERFDARANCVMLTDCGEPFCYKEATIRKDL